jgi:hypothetical protein
MSIVKCAGECGLGPLLSCDLEGQGREDRSPFSFGLFDRFNEWGHIDFHSVPLQDSSLLR